MNNWNQRPNSSSAYLYEKHSDENVATIYGNVGIISS
jgi:hypothetical protein